MAGATGAELGKTGREMRLCHLSVMKGIYLDEHRLMAGAYQLVSEFNRSQHGTMCSMMPNRWVRKRWYILCWTQTSKSPNVWIIPRLVQLASSSLTQILPVHLIFRKFPNMTNNQETDGIIATHLKVLTWNIWWRYGPWESRHAAIIKTLKELDCDVIALQEVWQDSTTNQAAKIASELGYHHVFASSMEREGFGFGNAILSRWPIEQSDSTMLFGTEENGKGYLALFAEIAGPRGQLPVFNTHLSSKFEHGHIRQQQVADLTRFVDIKRPGTFPPIVCGDFNAESESDEIRMLKGLTTCPVEGLVFHDAWAAAGSKGPGFTWNNANPYVARVLEPDRRIDYIFVGWPQEKAAGHIVGCEVVAQNPSDSIYPSDHYGVVANLRY